MVFKLMESFALSLFNVYKVKKSIQFKKVLTRGFYGMLEKGILLPNLTLSTTQLRKPFLLFLLDLLRVTILN